MPKKPKPSNYLVELRRHAETRFRAQRPKARELRSMADTKRVFQELEVHQIELELQNIELQKVRDELELVVENYADLYDFAPMGYFSLDESGVVLEANLTGATLLGVDRVALIRQRVSLYLAPAGRHGFRTFLQQVFAGTEQAVCEAQVTKPDGGTLWATFRATSAISLKGTRKWCRVAFNDVSIRRRAQESLRMSEERFRALFESGPVAIYSCDTMGKIQEFNRRAVELWGRAPVLGAMAERFCGSHKLFRPDGRYVRREQCFMAEVLRGKQTEVRDKEVLLERPDGSRISAIVNIRRLTNEGGEVTGAINYFYDITDRKRRDEIQHRVEILAASNQKLEQEIVLRQQIEASLKQSEQQLNLALVQSRHMQEQLRQLSRQVLSSQEEERKRISRELHDVIAQTLTGINLRLDTLSEGAGKSPRNFAKSISRTQELVGHAVDLVHRFARELRPAVLDDLGLIPALHSFMKNFTAQTGVRTFLKAFAGVEQLDNVRRTVLYRVAQEALTNVARHAQASRVEVNIHKLPHGICMEIIDDGKSFRVENLLKTKGRKRLGLLGMRERLEMVGGQLEVKSAPGQGTSIRAQIPRGKSARRGAKASAGIQP